MLKSREENVSEVAVCCQNVHKEYYVYRHRTTSLREYFIRSIKRKPISDRQASFSLNDFDLRVEHGEAVGLIGRNGSGKSTALRLIAGIYRPTSGIVETHGRVAAVLELGAGFSPELTGEENLTLKGAIMGLTPAEVASQRDAILEFADIGDFIDTPMRYYSSGMKARLAFSIAFCIRPEILLLDEVFAVGDEAFRKKCKERLADFRRSGGTMVIASHAAPLVRQLCSRVIWLENGSIRMDGDVGEVLDQYLATASNKKAMPRAMAI